ncbi:hypothetical protein HRR90_007584 [Exophiala dermatitidis]|uniref:Uncharacterized protein n=1 Tax=Exophiala dermatitidis TaxID=5970 RepID=A0AAN6EL64_EXODE|nr:hypothetical protein HRR73_008847 [Exophiala dermatitidis]KAJ4504672.1 hypothetical protein HRR74_008938 [Exophiala dermatitidis]KAJ4533552.1 hypothetical protein HRR77_008528 [Exophiala dermatitidis]KAJ4602177.1 hypothetical protein HRR85_008717 [Exophiala dermatitidis]KAJ4627099.1 hypothetical protein HRR88_003605 [Exophiala dermatitidis]
MALSKQRLPPKQQPNPPRYEQTDLGGSGHNPSDGGGGDQKHKGGHGEGTNGAERSWHLEAKQEDGEEGERREGRPLLRWWWYRVVEVGEE